MQVLRILFYALIVRPFILLFLGLNVRHLDRLQVSSKAHLIAANHNSHLDTLVLMSLFKLADIPHVKLVAAKDYWCRGRALTWFSMNIIGIIPIERKGEGTDPLAPVMKALDENYTVVIFPEGSRGDPEKRAPLKYGITKLLEEKPKTRITPVFMYGLGKALPRGEALFVPFVCEVNVGQELSWPGDRGKLMSELEASFDALEKEIAPKEWM